MLARLFKVRSKNYGTLSIRKKSFKVPEPVCPEPIEGFKAPIPVPTLNIDLSNLEFLSIQAYRLRSGGLAPQSWSHLNDAC